ncbi:hypothetical protein CC1G_13826 [Coprinopsis cinerea okayama7|uniref:Uncharacterized protein n=1 Tax=Coprinopsis cinerea (strain Okayama-7 / 130 / ATCC MYA-4618 / FGSC 9003) TaxID=240176 RepID=D6RKF1_COPC7|nr:hypothetical protein CC1G_13826 [Coprinopsis cinerea okayama7\|eukprot:XP_002911791.1 hypothetical protein CC1G_13826 [Coprinopsis cinerea okayama7\
MKVTFLLNRYIPPLSIVAAVAFEFASLHTSEKAISGVVLFTTALSEVVLFIRVYALSNQSRLTAAFLILFWLVRGPVSSQTPLDDSRWHFIAQSIHISVFGNWLKAADIYELVMLLCLYFGLSKFWFSKNRLTRTFSRDGAYYFIVFSIVSIFNVVFSIIFRGQKHHYLSTPPSSEEGSRRYLNLVEGIEVSWGEFSRDFGENSAWGENDGEETSGPPGVEAKGSGFASAKF